MSQSANADSKSANAVSQSANAVSQSTNAVSEVGANELCTAVSDDIISGITSRTSGTEDGNIYTPWIARSNHMYCKEIQFQFIGEINIFKKDTLLCQIIFYICQIA